MDDRALIEAVLEHYRVATAWSSWRPPAAADLTVPEGGFSGGPYGLAVRYALRDSPAGRECMWPETSRMGGTSLRRLDPATGAVECLDSMQEMYVVRPGEDPQGPIDRMHAQNAAFWSRVAELGLDRDLPTHTVVNAFLTSADGAEPPASSA